MAVFYYKAKKGPEDIIESTLEAKTREEAISKISKMGYVPVQVTSGQAPKAKDRGLKPGLKDGFLGRVKSQDITLFVEQLASLVRSKIPVFEAVNILAVQTDNPKLKKVIMAVFSELKDGKTLSEALSRHSQIFSPLFINMIRSGETGGVLEETLNRLSHFRQEEEDLKAKVTASLVYPAFILVVGLATIFLLLTFGVPRLTVLFIEMDQALPLPTQILISVSETIRKYWYWAGLFILVFIGIIKEKGIIKKNKPLIDNFKLRLPLFGQFLKDAMLARFSRTFATLLANGIPVHKALAVTIPAVENESFRKELEVVKEEVLAGSSFAKSMKKCRWFPFFVTNMIAVSEKRGDLEGGLAEVANFYERQVSKMMKVMTSLFEPVIILVMGLMVAFIVLAMLLPVFDIGIGVG